MKIKKEVYEKLFVSTVIYESELWYILCAQRQKMSVLEVKCLSSIAGVTKRDELGMKQYTEKLA